MERAYLAFAPLGISVIQIGQYRVLTNHSVQGIHLLIDSEGVVRKQ